MATSIPDADESLLLDGVKLAEDRLNPLDSFVARAEVGKASLWPAFLTGSSSADTAILHDVCHCLYLMANARMQISDSKELIQARDLNRRAMAIARATGFNGIARALESQLKQILATQAGQTVEVVDRHSINDVDQMLAAVSLLRERHFDEAHQKLESLRKKEPFNMSLWFLIGVCHARTNQLHEAEGCFTTCIVAQPDYLPGHFYRGLCRLELKEFLAAESDFTRALDLDSTFIPAMINRSEARRKLQQYELALQDLNDAIGLGAPQTRIYFMRSELRKRLGDLKGASEDFERGIRAEPIDEQSFIRRGLALMKQQPEQAIEDFQRAAKMNRRSYAAYRNWAFVLGEILGRHAAAIEILDQMLTWVPERHPELISRSVMRARMNDVEGATNDLREALALSRDPKTVFQAACVYSITSIARKEHASEAMKLLKEAISADANWKVVARKDKDLDNLRNDEEFQRLLN
jgi:tetratricopeptide (TPR) repeat protein